MNNYFNDKFDDLARDIIKSASGRRIVYVPNPGNFGDGLIRSATKRFFYDYKIKHTEINVGYKGGRCILTPDLLRSKRNYFIYGGGGAWHNDCNFGYKVCKYINSFTKHYTVLPTTFSLDSTKHLVGKLYRRDERGSIYYRENSTFCYDMAFYLYAVKNSLPKFPKPNFEVGQFFRGDNEASKNQNFVGENLDLSTLGDHMSEMNGFYTEISKYETIHTDRLHVAIGGAILGKEVKIYTGNYFKIRDIYDSSMVDIENVELKCWDPDK
jgi:exopolysaccharide biosynthesis predicted pyruvyltransferase EpsI